MSPTPTWAAHSTPRATSTSPTTHTGQISEYSPSGQLLRHSHRAWSTPFLVFDNTGNLYVGQQNTPYIAEFNSSGQNTANIGPVTTGETGDDWIDLASDQCTFYYTTEGPRTSSATTSAPHQLSNFNQAPLSRGQRVRNSGSCRTATCSWPTRNAVLLLDPNGNVIQTYPCSSMNGCADGLFAIAIDPSGTSFWTDDAFSGDIWQVNIATGQVMQTIIATELAPSERPVGGRRARGGNSCSRRHHDTDVDLDGQQPVTGNFSTPTPVSAVLTNPSTGMPIVDEPVTFTLNGSETCTANTDATGTATCDITAGEPSSSYTLTASFPGDTTTSTPISSNSSTSTFTVNPDTSSLTYTGATTAVNGSSTTLSGTLTTDTPTTGTALPTKVVTFTIGSGGTAQSCSGTTDTSGDVSCRIPTVDQPQTAETVTSNFAGDAYDTPVAVTTPITVTEPTTLTVNPGTGNYSEPTTVSGVLQDTMTNTPIAGEPVTFTLNGTETCTGTTDATGTASCTITPGEAAAMSPYTLTGTFGGDSTLPLQLIPSNNSANFTVTPEPTTLTYTGGTTTQNGQPLTVSGVLTTETNTPIGSQPVTFTLGSGTTTQTCSATTSATGAASCVINVTGQPQGPIPVTDTFGGNSYYQQSSTTSTVNLPESTTLTVSPGSGTYNTPGTVSGTLVNTVTNAPVPNEPVTLTVNGTQKCTATTNASGVATCSITPNEPGRLLHPERVVRR